MLCPVAELAETRGSLRLPQVVEYREADCGRGGLVGPPDEFDLKYPTPDRDGSGQTFGTDTVMDCPRCGE